MSRFKGARQGVGGGGGVVEYVEFVERSWEVVGFWGGGVMERRREEA